MCNLPFYIINNILENPRQYGKAEVTGVQEVGRKGNFFDIV